MTDNILIATNEKQYSLLKYQIVYRNENGIIKLNSVNIIMNKKTLMKIYKEDTNIDFKVSNAKKIVSNFLNNKLKVSKTSKRKVNNKAKAKKEAAADLKSMFNL